MSRTTHSCGTQGLSSSGSRNWWQDPGIDLGECPITLESLSTLPYPPFALSNDGAGHGSAARHGGGFVSGASTVHDNGTKGRQGRVVVSYFDGLALATYIVSRGIFQNPLTRQDLSMQDCRRLDEYLEEYCFRNNNNNGEDEDRGTQFRPGTATTPRNNISVAEAFALRNSVRVEMGISSGNRSSSSNRSSNDGGGVQRMQALRSAATAALAGLFVYGNQGRSGPTHAGGGGGSGPAGRGPPRSDRLVLDWGFDLNRTVDDTAEQGGHGYTVVDDDEAAVVATRRHAYRTVQEAFPVLPSSSEGEDTAASGAAPSRQAGAVVTAAPDDRLVERVRAVSVRDREEEALRARQLELARRRHLQGALSRRDERRKLRAAELTRGAEVHQEQKEEEEEVRQARAEIEAWRDDQWEKLRLLSEGQRCRDERQEDGTGDGGAQSMGTSDESDLDGSHEASGEASEEAEVAKRKAKAAAKRKRAKERKKAQNAEERESMEQQQMKEAVEAKKAASMLKCAACGLGILDCGFEKFGETFCSPKCARSAKPNNPT